MDKTTVFVNKLTVDDSALASSVNRTGALKVVDPHWSREELFSRE